MITMRRIVAYRRLTWARYVFAAQSKTPDQFPDRGFWYRCLTMTYSHMGKPHTTIGDASFHY